MLKGFKGSGSLYSLEKWDKEDSWYSG